MLITLWLFCVSLLSNAKTIILHDWSLLWLAWSRVHLSLGLIALKEVPMSFVILFTIAKQLFVVLRLWRLVTAAHDVSLQSRLRWNRVASVSKVNTLESAAFLMFMLPLCLYLLMWTGKHWLRNLSHFLIYVSWESLSMLRHVEQRLRSCKLVLN